MKKNKNIFILLFSIGIALFASSCKDNHDVTGVIVSPKLSVIRVGESVRLTAVVSPSDADNKSVKWVYNKWVFPPKDTTQNIVSISNNGSVKGFIEGYAVVTCITDDMSFEDDATIVVGYATFVSGSYTGSCRQNGVSVFNSKTVSFNRTGEFDATFSFPYKLSNDTEEEITGNIRIDYFSNQMVISGESLFQESLVTISGAIDLNGKATFKAEIKDHETFEFFGQKN